jgi:hypothetical protein
MSTDRYGTIDGQPVTKAMLDGLSAEFEQDWPKSKVSVSPTSYGKALAALQTLEIPVDEIEALERRAKHENKPLSFFLRSVLQNELAG